MVREKSSARTQEKGEKLVYAVSTSGHRQSYVDVLGTMFRLEAIFGTMNYRLFRRMVRAERLLFASLDDDMVSFFLISIARSMLRRPTVALFLRPQKCFETGRWFYPLKRVTFRVLRALPYLTIATITPFEVAPRYKRVANIGVHDPQYWDFHDGKNLRWPMPSSLSNELARLAAGRRIFCALGSLSSDKGLSFLAETLKTCPEILEQTLIIFAGRIAEDSVSVAIALETAGVLMITRSISDEELESLYFIADGIWACYSPRYDQASGIFGRAAQLGITSFVREKSIIAATARLYGINHIEIPFGNHRILADALQGLEAKTEKQSGLRRNALASQVGSWRHQFKELVGASLIRWSRQRH